MPPTPHPPVLARPEPCTAMARRPVRPQRVDGRSRLTVRAGNRVGTAYQRTPCRILFPRTDFAGSLQAVLLNTAGGLTGGDSMRQEIVVESGAAATLTSQAAERIYRSAHGVTTIATGLTSCDESRLEWLPQETIAFDDCGLSRTTHLDLTGRSRALALEWLVLGRKAHGEVLRRGRIVDRWRVHRDGRLIWADGLRLDGAIRAIVDSPSQLAGSTALATLLCAAPDAQAMRGRARDVLVDFEDAGVRGGATLVDGLMLCRMLGRDGDALRPAVRRLVAELRDAFWGRWVGLPRVWNC